MILAEKISEMPELYERGDESTARLLLRSGYLDSPQALTVEDVEEALRRHSDLADRWLERGRDQRLAGGWSIECDHGQYRVQSYAGGSALVEKKKLHAVAEFIVRYVRFIGDMLSRHRARDFRTSQSHMGRSARIARNPHWWPTSPGYL
jgi:hypothetical protein